jgi:hypothetical protein
MSSSFDWDVKEDGKPPLSIVQIHVQEKFDGNMAGDEFLQGDQRYG